MSDSCPGCGAMGRDCECERLKEDYRLKAEQHARLAEICEGDEFKITELEQRIEAAFRAGWDAAVTCEMGNCEDDCDHSTPDAALKRWREQP